MGTDERRDRERKRRRDDILESAWKVAERDGFSRFSLERVATDAEVGRATIYSYFISIDELVADMASEALEHFRARLEQAESIEEALDVPVRLAQTRPAYFELLFPHGRDSRPHMASKELRAVQETARELIARIGRVAERQATALPEDARVRAALIAGISMASATVPELKASTTLRHQFQEICLRGQPKSEES